MMNERKYALYNLDTEEYVFLEVTIESDRDIPYLDFNMTTRERGNAGIWVTADQYLAMQYAQFINDPSSVDSPFGNAYTATGTAELPIAFPYDVQGPVMVRVIQ